MGEDGEDSNSSNLYLQQRATGKQKKKITITEDYTELCALNAQRLKCSYTVSTRDKLVAPTK